MKTLLTLLVVSLGANAALVGLFKSKPALAPAAVRNYFSDAPSASAGRASAAAAKDRIPAGQGEADARRKLWAALDTDDLPALIARLRSAGFSSRVIRAMISAKVDARFAAQMAKLLPPAQDLPFWKPDPMNMAMEAGLMEPRMQVYRERSRVLRDLFADAAFASDADQVNAQRRQFGEIPKSKIDLLQRINDDYAEMNSQIRATMGGITLPEDREKMALLERERRADIAAVLTPEELQSYDMRNSPTAARLRVPLGVMDAPEEEFRTIFRIQQQFADILFPQNVNVISSETGQNMDEARRQQAEQIKSALGPARYADFQRSSDREYQQLHQIAQREGVALDATVRAYNLRETFAAQSMVVFNDAALSADQKRVALQTLGQNARAQLVGILGETAATAYGQSSRWLQPLETGVGAITINPDGNLVQRRLPQPRN